MKFVFANKYYFLKGGAERYMFDLAALLERHGHEVVPFAMRDRRNAATPWRRHFVSPVRTERVSFSLAGARTAGRMLYSFEAKRKFARLLDRARPDLVHVHNIYHQISPSILPEAARRGIPVVLTAHDYKLVAPNYTLYHDGAVCEHTKPDRWWEAVRNRCVKGSKLAGALEAAEMWLHRRLGLYARNVARIVCPSRFVMALLEEYGIPGDKLVHVPHFIDPAAWTPSFEGGYALFVGRLSQEKGAAALVRAAAARPEIPVHVVGAGPEEQLLKDLARRLGAENVVFRGWLEGEDLRREYAGSRFVVVPSLWYEVFGLTVLEAYASGKPVIASQMGGLAELVRDGETGALVSAGDADGLAALMAELWAEPGQCEAMGREARAWVERDFGPKAHYRRIMAVYEEARRATAKKKGKRG